MMRHVNEPAVMPAIQNYQKQKEKPTIKVSERLHCVSLKYRYFCERTTKFEDHPTLLTT
jgi:hypothetical protein